MKNEGIYMDKQDNKPKDVTSPVLPMENKSENILLPKENNQEKKDISVTSDLTLPTLNIEKSEAQEETPQVAGKSVLDNKADFQSIFQVESEETPEEKKQEATSIEAPKVAVKKYDEPALPVEKAQTIEEINEKKSLRLNNFNGEEKTIFEIKEEKEGNPIVVVLFFLALISCIIALPYISKKIEFNNGIPVSSKTPTESGSTEDQFFYFDRTSVRARIGNLEFTNFVKHKRNNKYTLTFNISNKQSKAYTYDEKYYVVFYEGEKIVYRALIYSPEAIGANAITNAEININERSYSESDRFKIEEILTSSYPTTVLNNAEGEYRILTCNYLNDEIKYYFLDNKLVKYKEVYHEELLNNTDYQADLEKYSLLSEKYKTITNFNSYFITSASDFMMVNEFEYKEIPDTILNNLNEYKFFRYNESKDVINFEMEALSYNCG